MMGSEIWISAGSNVAPEENLPLALERLSARLEVLAVSRVFETPAVGSGRSPDFLNAALRCRTELEPLALRDRVLREVECELGRRRSNDRFSPRTIDLDISLFGDRVFEEPESDLEIPDPDILACAHVAVPLADLSPTKLHPVSGETLAAIGLRLNTRFPVRPLSRWRLA